MAQQGTRIGIAFDASGTINASIGQGLRHYVQQFNLPWQLIHADKSWSQRSPFDAVMGFFREQQLLWAQDQGCPILQLGQDLPQCGRFVRIIGDDEAIGHRAAHYLYDQGYRSFALVKAEGAAPIRARMQAFCRHAEDLGLLVRTAKDFVFQAKESGYENGEAQLGDWLKSLPRPLAVFCHQDRAAYALIRICTEQGLRIPEDVAVLGVDNHVDLCVGAAVPFSSIALPWFHIGRLAGLSLHRMLSGENLQETVKVHPLYVEERRSTAMVRIDDPLVRQVLKWLERHLSQEIVVEDLAQRLGTTRSTLHRRLQAATGMHVTDHLHRLRIKKACELLLHCNESVTRIGQRVGYNSYQRFHSMFRRKTGTSPADFRQQMKSSEMAKNRLSVKGTKPIS